MSAMPLDDEQGPERRLPPGTTRAFVASTATELAGEFASGGTRLALGVALSAAAGAAVWFLGDGTGHWWPWLGLLVLAAGAFVARTRWRLARYRVALVVAVVGAGANLALGATTLPAVVVAAVAAAIAIAAVCWSLTEALLTS